MVSFNKVILGGNMTRDPELRFTQAGIPVCNFGLAVNRVRSKMDEVDFFDVTAWRELGETVANYKKKGDPILVEGRLQFRSWEADDGSKRNKVDVVADTVQFLSGPNGQGGQNGDSGSSTGGSAGGVRAASGARGGDVEPEDDDFDDIPFRAVVRRPLVF